MKKISLSANEDLIKRAQAKARANKTTLTAEFRLWLKQYAETPEQQKNNRKTKSQPQDGRLTRCVQALKKFEKKLEEKL